MRCLAIVLGLFVGSVGFAQGTAKIPYAPNQTKATPEAAVTLPVVVKAPVVKAGDECPPPPPSKKKPDCKPKPKPKPKPTPKPCPTAKPCPAAKSCPDCPPCEPKVIEKTIEKTKYVDRTVTIDQAPKNTLNLMIGVGPHGIVTDSYQTGDRQDEYAFRKERDKSVGGLIGLQYQYRFTPTFNANGLILSNQTVMAGGGVSW